MLIKVRASGEAREEIKRTADIFRAQIVDVTSSLYTIQLIGTQQKIDAFIEAVKDSNVIEVVRSGVSGIARGEKVLALYWFSLAKKNPACLLGFLCMKKVKRSFHGSHVAA